MRRFLMLLPLTCATALGAQPTEVRSYWNTSRHEVRSTVNQLDYQLFVSLPVGYATNDTTKYPTLYILDAPNSYWLVQAMTAYLSEGGGTPRMILVGVGYPDSSNGDRRRVDLTPTTERGAEAPPSGGAAAFLATFRRDFIPLIEKNYRANGDRALLGHSFGGLFAVYTLFNAPDLFNRYGILSPSMWWDDYRLLGELSKATPPSIATGARVFVAVGEDEIDMRPQADSVTALLKRMFGSKLTLDSRRYPGNHQSYFPEAVTPALKFLYPKPNCFGGLATAGGRAFSVLKEPDRLEIERFARNANTISGAAYQAGGPCFRYRFTLDDRGRVISAHADQDLGLPRTSTVQVRGTTLRVETTDPSQVRSVEVPASTSLFRLIFLGSIDPLVRLAPSRIGDSTLVELSNFGRADGTQTSVIARISRDSVRVSNPRFELRVHVSPKLDMLGGTTRALPGGAATKWIVARSQ